MLPVEFCWFVVHGGVLYLILEPLHQSLSDELLLNSTQTSMSGKTSSSKVVKGYIRSKLTDVSAQMMLMGQQTNVMIKRNTLLGRCGGFRCYFYCLVLLNYN